MALEELIGRKLYSSKNLSSLDEHTIIRIASTFRHIRRVCGDGDSFYRAVYFGLLEHMTKEIIILFDEEDDKASKEAEALLFKFFDKLLSLRRMQSSDDRYELESLRVDISKHCQKVKSDESIKNNPGIWLQKKIIIAPQIDEVLVRACRCVVAEYLEDLVAAEQAENALTEVIKVNLDGLTVNQFIDQVVLMPGRVADKVLVSFASRAFASRFCVWQLDLYADERLHCLTGGDEDLSVLPVFFGELHLLLHGERYDIMYYQALAEMEAWAEPGASAESGDKESEMKRARPTALKSQVADIITKLRSSLDTCNIDFIAMGVTEANGIAAPTESGGQVAIQIVALGGIKYILNVLESDSVATLKSKLRLMVGVGAMYQRLVLAGRELEDHCTISECGVRAGDKIAFERIWQKFTIQILHPVGNSTAELEVDTFSTVDAVKAQLKGSFGLLRPDEVRLIFDGRDLLGDNHTLGYFDVPPNAVLKCKTVSRLWTSSNFLLSQVASFLQLSDAVKIMSVLSGSKRLVGDVVIAPSAQLVNKMIGRALRKDVAVDAKTLLWKNLGQGAANHSQMVTLPELRMLYHLLKAIPSDLELDVDGRSELKETLAQDFEALACLDDPSGQADAPVCTLSAQIPDKGLAVELKIKGKPCFQVECPCFVLSTCPVCENICCACIRKGHAEECFICCENVCPSCIVPSDFHDLEICKMCGFQCSECLKAQKKNHKFICAAGIDCDLVGLVCMECIDDTAECESCDSVWCLDCVVFPECSVCERDLCDTCSEMENCTLCDNTAHKTCALDYFNTCKVCNFYCCSDCETMKCCVYEYCGKSICEACTDDEAVGCLFGHMTCRGCVDSVYEQCLAKESELGGRVIGNKRCWKCWAEAYAQFFGFDDNESYCQSVEMMESGYITTFLDGSPPQLQQRLQEWWLGGIAKPEFKYFNTCSFLKTTLASMSNADKADPRLIDQLLASSAVRRISVWSNEKNVQAVSCSVHVESEIVAPSRRLSQHVPSTLTLAPGERVVSLHIRYNVAIVCLRLVTSAGRDMRFGGTGGKKWKNYRVPVGWQLAGLFGGSTSRLRHLGVVIAKDPV